MTNVGVDASQGFVLENGFVAFRVWELDAGVDLNGDGDTVDFVVHIYDTVSGALTNTGVESSGQMQVSGSHVAWTVAEFAQGFTDLNGDGDTNDRVLHYADMSTGTVTNVGLAATSPAIVGNTLGARVIESAQGMTDLNGDSDANDGVLHLVDLSSGTVENVGVDAAAGFVIDGERVVFGASEANEDSTDLNLDGDVLDFVLHVWDGVSATNLGLVSETSGFQLEGDLLAFISNETSAGGASLNGDADVLDDVVHVHDFATGATTNLGLAVRNGLEFQLNGGLVAMAVREIDQGGVSLNGDADASDDVLHLYDPGDGTVTNLSYAVQDFQLDDGHLAFSIPEAGQEVDLNGDLDTNDLVLHLYDTADGMVTNLMTDASLGFKLEGHMLLGFGAYEGNQGDGNGDGDTDDFTLYVFDISAGLLRNLAVDPSDGVETFLVDGQFVSFGVNEEAQANTDFNGDGDANDVVLHYFDAGSGISTNLMRDARMGQQLQNGTIAFLVDEQAQGMQDLNGDGDVDDLVLHIAQLSGHVSPHDMIEALIAHVQSLDWHPRLERRRVLLLRLAQRALAKDRPCLAMQFVRLFSGSVHKRAGRGIPEADAGELMAEADAVVDTLQQQYPECARHDHRRCGSKRRHHR